VEQVEFEEVLYWPELVEIMEWSKTHVTSTFHICWGAQAGLYYHYGIRKHAVSAKIFGIYEHQVMNRKVPLVRGFDDYFLAPHSRHTAIDQADVEKVEDLQVLAVSEEAGVFICMSQDGRRIFVTGHPEYDRVTLGKEYHRDKDKGLEISIPKNYYPQDQTEERPLLQWRAHANTLYTNWLNYYVYQATPYKLEEVGQYMHVLEKGDSLEFKKVPIK